MDEYLRRYGHDGRIKGADDVALASKLSYERHLRISPSKRRLMLVNGNRHLVRSNDRCLLICHLIDRRSDFPRDAAGAYVGIEFGGYLIKVDDKVWCLSTHRDMRQAVLGSLEKSTVEQSLL